MLTKKIHSIRFGAWEMAPEQGGYYYLCQLGTWIEFKAPDCRYPDQQLGARWSIDRWASFRDTPAFPRNRTMPDDGTWRIEIPEVVFTGWRDGSIGGPNGEQPSLNRWILWGENRNTVRCLPLGSEPPRFEFALYLKQQEIVYWENNRARNFSLCLDNLLNNQGNSDEY